MHSEKTVIVVGAGASHEAGLPTSAELKRSIARDIDIKIRGLKQTSGDRIIAASLQYHFHDINPHLHACWKMRDALPQAMSIDNFIDSHKKSEKIELCGKLAIARSILQAEQSSKLSLNRPNTYKDNTLNFLLIHEAQQGCRDATHEPSRFPVAVPYPSPHRATPAYVVVTSSDLDTSRNKASVSGLSWISRLFFVPLEDTWFNVFWQRISENCQAEGLGERLSSIVLIVFNYDRCIEHFLIHAIRNYYGMSADNAASLINKMKIYHPYGKVGSLPWTNGTAQMEFGGEPSAQHLMRLAEQIKTFTEGTNPEASDILEIRRQVATADTLVFLGFAYHRQNLELLERPADRKNNREREIKCYGTAFGISEADLGVIESEISELLGPMQFYNLERNLTCSELFNKYRRTLSFA